MANAVLNLQVRLAPANPRFNSEVPGSLSEGTLTTDNQGYASSELRFGTIVGTWYVVAQDFQRGAIDSIPFTVKAGAPARIKMSLRDTAAFVGGGYQIDGSTTDRRGNAVSGVLTYATDSVSGVASVTATGRVTGLAVGRARILLRVAGTQAVDTARLSVVPPGKLAAVSTDGLSVLNVDGSAYRTLVPGNFQYLFPSWSPDGAAVVYNSASPAAGMLYRVDLQGRVSALTGAAAMPSETWPRYSPDGQFLFFSGGLYPDSIDTYRMRADGTGPRVRVTPARTYSTRYWKASPSPDGTLLAYSEAGFELKVMNLNTGVSRSIATPEYAESPRFSPSGQWIAFANEYRHTIEIIRADGTGHRVLTSPAVWADNWGHDWSPDGEWIVYSVSGGLRIVRVSDGVSLPLPYSRSFYAASWHQ